MTIQSRAGLNVIGRAVQNFQGDARTDCRKPVNNHGSPDLLNLEFDKSPTMLNGKLEHFADISKMILRWGEEEGVISAKEEQGGRRRSQRIDELCGQFEPASDGQQDDLEIDAKGVRGEGGNELFPTMQTRNLGPKIKEKSRIFVGGGVGCDNKANYLSSSPETGSRISNNGTSVFDI